MTLHSHPATAARRTREPRLRSEIEREHLALLFQDCVERYGDKTALRYQAGGRWHDMSWRELGEKIESIAKGLLELGVQEGERVGICSANRPEWTIVDLAAMRIRASPCPSIRRARRSKRSTSSTTRESGCPSWAAARNTTRRVRSSATTGRSGRSSARATA